jgi:hypothetical protein
VKQAAKLIATPQAIKKNRLNGQRRFAYRQWLRERRALASERCGLCALSCVA